MFVYDMRGNSVENPLGTDKNPVFSWKVKSEIQGARQLAYKLEVAEDKDFRNIAWNSGKINSDISVGIPYGGKALKPSMRYYWRITLWYNPGIRYVSDLSYFETGLMGTDAGVWNGAKWICAPVKTVNTAVLDKYSIEMDFCVPEGNKAGIVLSARNKDNYTLLGIDMDNRRIEVFHYCDGAWDDYIPYVLKGCTPIIISKTAVPEGSEYDEHHIKISVNGRHLSIWLNNHVMVNDTCLLPQDIPNQPGKTNMMQLGFNQSASMAYYGNIIITDSNTGVIYQQDEFLSDNGLLAELGTVKDGRLCVKNRFELICPVPALTVRNTFHADKTIKSARLYVSAKGFYDVYINGDKINKDFYNPGFTDYRLRVCYQTYDVTDKIRQGINMIGAIVGKGYWSGFCGYSGAQIYGRQNAFICQLVINYTDGLNDIIVTDKSWKCTDKTPVIDTDYLDGETYDARFELTGWGNTDYNDSLWKQCSVCEWDTGVILSGSALENLSFKLSAQEGRTAEIKNILAPLSKASQPERGHFVYDFGQNIVGTVRLAVKGEAGISLKIRYGEMCDNNGRLYVKNLRTAANTDVYTLRGDREGEVYVPSFTAHGFRYVEITGNGFMLDSDNIILDIEGLVINNLGAVTGGFECSNKDINQLQSNIQWGLRGNALLTLTDCPQRNERMGWTGDAQVFAKTGAYNMDMHSFAKKWLLDVCDAQLLYNKNGAVPDTAPLGGDNRRDGCAGWGDAAVIVPWEMYMAYGDKSILEENYNVMKKWIEYQSRGDRQNYGMRIIDGKECPCQSDLSDIPYIQVQQRRGDHLACDITTPYILSATAYAAHSADIMSRTAGVLGRKSDERKYRTRFENIKKAFNSAWVKPDGSIAYWGEMSLSENTKTSWGRAGIDKNGNSINSTYYSDTEESKNHPSQTAYALAIDFNLIDEDKKTHAAKCLKKAVERNDGLLSVGFLGISHIIPALCKSGMKDEAYKLLEKTENPGWLYSVKNGATTIWERWDSYISETGSFGSADMNSFNHYAYGAVGEWLFGGIAGINAGEAGYKHILLTPSFGGTLTYARAWHECPYGKIESEWEMENGKFIYRCTIPANTTATLCLPAEDGVQLHELESGGYSFVTKIHTAQSDMEGNA